MVFAASVAVAMLADPPSARATCGDYVKVGTHTPMSSSHSSMPSTSDFRQHDTPKPIQRPCSGPSCSENHKPITPPSSPPVSVEVERWIHFSLLSFSAAGSSGLLPLDLIDSRPSHDQRSVYHPPR